jgi:hypothetical protein
MTLSSLVVEFCNVIVVKFVGQIRWSDVMDDHEFDDDESIGCF